jgi:hypothetical protein
VRCTHGRYSCPSGATCQQYDKCQDLRNGHSYFPATLNLRATSPSPLSNPSGDFCGAILANYNVPNYCTCQGVHFLDDRNSGGGRLNCAIEMQSQVRVTVQAEFMPCSRIRKPRFTFSAFADSAITVRQNTFWLLFWSSHFTVRRPGTWQMARFKLDTCQSPAVFFTSE